MKQLNWKTVKRKVNELLPLEINPRKISDENQQKLIKSMEKFNVVEIPAINFDNKIIAGHQRLKAMQLIGRGEEEIDVRFPDRLLTDDEVKEYNLISNTHSGEWDFEKLEQYFSDIDTSFVGIDIDSMKKVSDFESMLELRKSDSQLPEVVEDDYEIPEEIQTQIVPGDLIQIGRHKLICGDSTNVEAYETLMGGAFADIVITDPPYNVAYTGKTKKSLTIQNDKQSDDNFYKFLYDFYTAVADYTKPGGAFYIWHADSEGANFRRAMKDAGILVKQCLIWVKQSMVLGRQDYQWKHEPCLYGWKEGAAHNWYSDRKQTTVLEFDRPSRNAQHPTMKPIPLIAYQLKNSSKQGDLVIDPFGGSGTTMLAAHQTNRTAHLIELDPKYCQVIVDRMAQYDPSLTILLNGKPWTTPKTF